MGIFSINPEKLKSILEVEIDGVEQENPDEDEDYTSDSDDTSSENNEEPSDSEEGSDDEDYTAGVDSAGDDDSSEEGSDEGSSDEDSDNEDYTSGIDDAGSEEGEEPSDSEEGSDDEEDYTAGVDSAGDDDSGEESSDEGSSDEDSDDESGEEGEEATSDDTSFENLKKIEAELFSNLTPEQIAIKNYELKQNFINLYGTIGSTLARINDISKSDDNIETLKFITDKLLELREMIDFNITTAYQTRTYIENNIIYQQCLSTLNAISDIIQTIPNPVKNDENEDNENEDNIVDDLESSENNETEQELEVGDKMMENTMNFNDYL